MSFLKDLQNCKSERSVRVIKDPKTPSIFDGTRIAAFIFRLRLDRNQKQNNLRQREKPKARLAIQRFPDKRVVATRKLVCPDITDILREKL